jgi:hypothetical protein
MKTPNKSLLPLLGILAAVPTSALGSVAIVMMKPTPDAPQPIGKYISWAVKATDSNAGPLTFQFNINPPRGQFTMVRDFNAGTLADGVWTAPSFDWVPTGIEGVYQVQVVAKDFASGQSATETFSYTVTALVNGTTPVVEKTANPLVALFSAPACAGGSQMRVAYQEQSGGPPTAYTNWVSCHPPATMTFEVAGMYADTAYNMYAHDRERVRGSRSLEERLAKAEAALTGTTVTAAAR